MKINNFVKFLLMLISGAFLSLSAPGYDLWIIAWFGLSPLFIIINTSTKIRDLLIYPFIFGFSYNLCYLHWLFSLHPLDWLGFDNISSFLLSLLILIVISAYNSLYFILFSVFVALHKKFSVSPYNKGLPNLILIVFFWLIIFNKLSSLKLFLGFPWTLIEYSQYKNLFMIQIAEYFGSVSISFLLVFFNLIVSNFLLWMFNMQKIAGVYVHKKPAQMGEIIKGFTVIFLLITLNLLFGAFLYGKNQERFSNKSKSVSVLQGNLPVKVTRGMKPEKDFAQGIYKDLIYKNDAELFILPEGSIPLLFNSDYEVREQIKLQAKKKDSDLIFGTYCEDNSAVTNCAVSYSRLSDEFSFYEKSRLVPFGEFTPLSLVLPEFLKRFARNIIGEGFSDGKKILPISTSVGKAGVNICFELIFPSIIRKHSLEGADFLVNLSDLSWFSDVHLKKQFLAFAVFRAIENRKFVIIASNNGISVFVEPSGRIKSQSLPNNRGVLADWINTNRKKTFYTKYGW